MPFFAVSDVAATTNGTYFLSRLSGAAMLIITLIRKPNLAGYTLIIEPELLNYPKNNESAAASYINKVIEREILRAPEQYL